MKNRTPKFVVQDTSKQLTRAGWMPPYRRSCDYRPEFGELIRRLLRTAPAALTGKEGTAFCPSASPSVHDPGFCYPRPSEICSYKNMPIFLSGLLYSLRASLCGQWYNT